MDAQHCFVCPQCKHAEFSIAPEDNSNSRFRTTCLHCFSVGIIIVTTEVVRTVTSRWMQLVGCSEEATPA